jgi:hypothetical protein
MLGGPMGLVDAAGRAEDSGAPRHLHGRYTDAGAEENFRGEDGTGMTEDFHHLP